MEYLTLDQVANRHSTCEVIDTIDYGYLGQCYPAIYVWATEADSANDDGGRTEACYWLIDDDMVQALRDESGEVGDLEQVEICDGALSGDTDDLGECARVIHAARSAV